MNTEEQKKDLEARVNEVLAFVKEREIFIGATQKISQEGYIENVPLYRDLKKYVRDVEVKDGNN